MTSTDRRPSESTPEPTLSPVVELRQYSLHPGKRDVLINLFDREFVESQEALGIKVIGQFRDIDDPNRFVWLRGFQDMATRAQGLEAFYGGPVWRAYRAAANATMVDPDNVLLLRPAQPGSGFSFGLHVRPPRGTTGHGNGLVLATVYSVDVGSQNAFTEYFWRRFRPALVDAGATILAFFVTEHSQNNFPALPVRESEEVFVWFAGFADRTPDLPWRVDHTDGALSTADAPGLNGPPQRLRLTPTARSLVTGESLACPAVASLNLGT